MRKLFFGFILALTAGSLAPVSEAASHDWTGPYVGANIGGAFGRSKPHTTVRSTNRGASYFITTDFDQIDHAGSDRLSPSSFISGAQAGFNYQARKFVFGLETDIDGVSLDRANSATQEYLSAPGTSFTIEHSIRTHWLCTIRPRAGWAIGKALLYGTSGMAISKLHFEEQFSDTFTPAFESSSKARAMLGWVIGAGAEYALTQHWTVRAEYLFTAFGKLSSNNSPLVLPTGQGDEFDQSIDLNIHTIRLGINFNF